jgi:hypothetical protein
MRMLTRFFNESNPPAMSLHASGQVPMWSCIHVHVAEYQRAEFGIALWAIGSLRRILLSAMATAQNLLCMMGQRAEFCYAL